MYHHNDQAIAHEWSCSVSHQHCPLLHMWESKILSIVLSVHDSKFTVSTKRISYHELEGPERLLIDSRTELKASCDEPVLGDVCPIEILVVSPT